MMEYINKNFYFIKVKIGNCTDYYGKHCELLPMGRTDNLTWYIKELGFETLEDAQAMFNTVDKMLKRLRCSYQSMSVTNTIVRFLKEDAQRFGFINQ